jgi:hypothetical protein
MLMNTEIYDALKSAQGVTEDQARAAAISVAQFEDRFVSLQRQMDKLDAKVDKLAWMVGILSVIMFSGFGVTIKYLIDIMSRLPR